MKKIEKENITNIIESIPVQVPRKRIYARLGYHFQKTEIPDKQKAKIETDIETAFSLCTPRGVWLHSDIYKNSKKSITLSNGANIRSESLAKMLEDSFAILVMAATVGKGLMEAIEEKIKEEDAATALIYDAVGSESADAALSWINEYLRQTYLRYGNSLTERRFSPGYGDLKLNNQKIFHDMLKLDQLGISITERFLLVPEKSVIGIAGVK